MTRHLSAFVQQINLFQMLRRRPLSLALSLIAMGSALLLPLRASANPTITANSCSQTDVANALGNVSADYTTVLIPAGNCTWGATTAFSNGNASVAATGTLSYKATFHVVIQGAGNPTGVSTDGLSNPTGYNDQTIIQDAVNHSLSNATLSITTSAGKTFRITGVSFIMSSSQTSPSYGGIVAIGGLSHAIRFDHNHVEATVGSGSKGLQILSWVYGVIDHNVFQGTGANVNHIEVNGSNWNNTADPNGDSAWNDLSYFGSEKFVFTENNSFIGSGTAFDLQQGGKIVFRYNSLTQQNGIQTHGIGHGARDRSPRAFEVYGNVANFAYTPGSAFNQFLMMEGGTMLFWGNTTTGYKDMIMGDVVRANSTTYSQVAPPNGWGYCGNGVSGSTSAWDQNTSTTGYPCIDQIGRGKGDLLTGNSFPGVTDVSTGTQSWPNQALEPVYVWGNAFNPPTSETDFYWSEAGDNVTAENRDYYLELPNHNESTTFNGTFGIGCGPSSSPTCANPVSQPASCTAGVGYWNTSSNTLYQCAATNTWKSLYTPYAYPHPLASVTPAWGNVDYWLPMTGSPVGTALTPSVLAGGTMASATWTLNPIIPVGFTIGQNLCGMPGSLTIGGVTYPATTPTQAIALNSATNYTYATGKIGVGSKQAVASGCIVMGAAQASPAYNGKNFDLVYFNNSAASSSVVLQLNNGNPCYCVRIETNPGSVRSPDVTLTPGNTYWFSLLFDEVNGVAKLAIFDPTQNLAQVSGSPSTVTQSTGNTMQGLVIGNGEIGTSTGTLTYGTWVVDTTNVIWPNVPQPTGGTVALPAPPTNIQIFAQ
jgi:hypothetical protein